MSTARKYLPAPLPGKESAALAQIRTAAQALLDEGQQAEAVDYFLSALAAVLCRNTELELLLLKLRRERLGTRSEKISPEQLTLLLEALQQQLPETATEPDLAEEEREDAQLDQLIKSAEQAAAENGAGEAARPRSRNWHARGAQREVHQVDVAEAERVCPRCGREKRRIGKDLTHRLVYVPAHFIDREYQLAKYACCVCKDGVTTAEAPPAVIERSTADASVLAHIVVSKYADHTPLHRLHRIYERTGADIPVSTLASWTAAVADRLQPLADALVERVLRAYVVRTDATGLKVLDPDSPDNIERGTLWCYVGDDRDVLFRYAPTGAGESGPWQCLVGRTGYIQADAASVFDRLFSGQAASAVEVGCWAHARRKFDALRDTDCRVAYPLQLIRRLYRIEHLADVQQLAPEQRALLRGERSPKVLDKLKRWLLVNAQNEPPASDFAKAIGYALNQWEALERFVTDGRLDLDNNLCERQLRDVAIGRKNYLFAGSHEGAQRTAVLYSIMRTCAQHGVAPLPYLTDVLRKLAAGWPQHRTDELLPDRWRDLHAAGADGRQGSDDPPVADTG